MNAIDEARKLVGKDRQADYGSPRENWGATKELWNWWLEGRTDDLTERDCAMMMVMAKLARERFKHKKDNIVDMIGYLHIYEDKL